MKNFTFFLILSFAVFVFTVCDDIENKSDDIAAAFDQQESKKQECESQNNHFWNGSRCVNPCESNPCGNNATCQSISYSDYECRCSYGLFWNGYECRNIPLCDLNGITPCKDKDTGYIWSALAKEKMNWDSAITYCEELVEGGYSDWNLPSIEVWKTFCFGSGLSKLKDDGVFWSSTLYNSNEKFAWVYSFFDRSDWIWAEQELCSYDVSDTAFKSSSQAIRCFRW